MVGMRENRALTFRGPSNTAAAIDRFLTAVNELEHHLEEKYLRLCDLSVPLNLLASYMAKSAVSQIRLSVFHPKNGEGDILKTSEEDARIIIKNSTRVIEFDVLAHTNPVLSRFSWHFSNFFPFEAFILLITVLGSRLPGDIVEQCWGTVDKVYSHHPQFITDSYDALYWAMGSLTLKTWNNCLDTVKLDQRTTLNEPSCISKLRNQRMSRALPTDNDAMKLDGFEAAQITHESMQTGPEIEREVSKQADGTQKLMSSDQWGFWQDLLESRTEQGWEAQELAGLSFALAVGPSPYCSP